MSNVTAIRADVRPPAISVATEDHVTMTVNGQLFGVPVLTVQDVLGSQTLTRIPMASKEVAGVLNLRGKVITVIDIREILGLPPRAPNATTMNVVVDHDGELYSLIVDSVGEVLGVSTANFEANPTTMNARWRNYSKGVYCLEDELMIAFDVAALLQMDA